MIAALALAAALLLPTATPLGDIGWSTDSATIDIGYAVSETDDLDNDYPPDPVPVTTLGPAPTDDWPTETTSATPVPVPPEGNGWLADTGFWIGLGGFLLLVLGMIATGIALIFRNRRPPPESTSGHT